MLGWRAEGASAGRAFGSLKGQELVLQQNRE